MALTTRRSFLALSAAVTGSAGLAACGTDKEAAKFITSSSPRVAKYEAGLDVSGRKVATTLRASATSVDLGGVRAKTWAFGGEPTGPEIRLHAGDRMVTTVHNQLPHDTSVHWHGVALRNDMDGVPMMTQEAIAAGESFKYDAIVPDPGTYWYHSHVGTQLDRGLSGPLIIEDPREPLHYDHEWVIFLKDWMDGITGTPDDVLKELSHGMGGMKGMGNGSMNSSSPSSGAGMSGKKSMGSSSMDSGDMDMGENKYMLMGAESKLLGGDAGDVKYPYYLINGRTSRDPRTFRANPGDRVRLRIINAGGDTAFRVAVGGHRMTVTHTDGYPVQHQVADALLLGNGERYDAIITLKDGVFPLVAVAEGKKQQAVAVIRTGSGRPPKPDVKIRELSGKIPTASQLRPAGDVRLKEKDPDRTIQMRLTGGMAKYDWGINGHRFNARDRSSNRFGIKQGERVRIEWKNTTDMFHPLHLHGHTFQIDKHGTRKDTAIVLPQTTLAVSFDADNPGVWAYHCHNSYHQNSGLMGSVVYQA